MKLFSAQASPNGASPSRRSSGGAARNLHIRTACAVALLICGIMTALLAGCERNAQSKVTPPLPAVTTVEAVARDVPVYLDSIGKSVATEMVSVQPQVSGRITKIHFVDGAELKKSDVLFTIDPRPFQAQLHLAEATLAEKKAVRELAKIQFNRYAGLLEARSISQSDYDQRKNALDIADAQVRESEAQVETSKLNLEYCTIVSPIDGRAGQRLVDVGNVVAANTGSLLVIQRLNPIYADFTIPEENLTAVQDNMNAGTLKVEVRLPDDSEQTRCGSLTFLDNAVQDGVGTVKLRATVPNKDRHFWPGRFLEVRLVLRTLSAAVLIPAAASQMSAKGPFVYVIKEDASAELRPVKLGQRQGDLVVVDDGLKPGERVVLTGQIGVIPGGKVRVDGTADVADKASSTCQETKS
jgi:membrane fusion protein, multidrug efflux system